MKTLKEATVIEQPVESKKQYAFVKIAPAYKVPPQFANNDVLKYVKYLHLMNYNPETKVVRIKETGTLAPLSWFENYAVWDAKVQDSPEKAKALKHFHSEKTTSVKNIIGHSFTKGSTKLYCIGRTKEGYFAFSDGSTAVIKARANNTHEGFFGDKWYVLNPFVPKDFIKQRNRREKAEKLVNQYAKNQTKEAIQSVN